jgi:transposase
VNEALAALERDFGALYAPVGRPSIPPEKLLRAMLLQAFYSIRSERQLMERLDYDLLFRRFVGLGVDDAVWDHSTFSKNRDRLLAGDIAAKFLAAVLGQPRVKRLLSSEHFSVDGTLIEAWAPMKSFKPCDGSDEPPASGGGRNAEADERDPACGAEHHQPALGDRRPDDPSSRLCRQLAHPETHRGGLRVDQDGRRPAQDQIPRRRPRRLRFHLRRSRLQPRPAAEAAPGGRVMASQAHPASASMGATVSAPPSV